jgi:hypothetical protein
MGIARRPYRPGRTQYLSQFFANGPRALRGPLFLSHDCWLTKLSYCGNEQAPGDKVMKALMSGGLEVDQVRD